MSVLRDSQVCHGSNRPGHMGQPVKCDGSGSAYQRVDLGSGASTRVTEALLGVRVAAARQALLDLCGGLVEVACDWGKRRGSSQPSDVHFQSCCDKEERKKEHNGVRIGTKGRTHSQTSSRRPWYRRPRCRGSSRCRQRQSGRGRWEPWTWTW